MSAASTSRLVGGPGSANGTRPWLADHERLVLGLLGVVGFLAIWEVGGRAGMVDRAFFSRPTEIVAAGITEVQNPRFWRDFRVSVFEFWSGYLLAVVTAVPIGLAAGWFRRLQYVLDPWLNFFNSLPRVALLPVLVILFGLGVLSKIAVVYLGAFFSIVIPTVQGVRTVDRRYVDVAVSFRASKRLLFLSVVGPATVPFIITGLRLGVARALIGVVTGELYAATEGLGVMIRRAAEIRQGDRMLFGVLMFTLAGILSVEAIRRVEARFQRWRPSIEERR
jgi:ABC-type nitrate/sulfonate/bicarbonate transport system permease component